MTFIPPRPPMYTRTLGNGLRVQLAPEPGALRAGITVHYGVGFRSERPGREGFAHLFEHLMFRGSASLPDGRFYDHVRRWGGAANGTTHPDYTDYFQVVPLVALEAALFAEADRMRAPRFTASSLADQLSGVTDEIDQAVRRRPYGGFPWPLLPSVLFDRHVNAHNGYGDPADLARISLDDCEDFFDAHYTPGNAVLTVVGDIDVQDVDDLVERHFGDIPARPAAAVPLPDEELPTADRRLTVTEPGVPLTALAVGHRLPDPATDLVGYLAHLVLGRLTAGRAASIRLPGLTASCGVFGPLDARDPDALVTAGLLAADDTPARAIAGLRGLWAGWGDPGAVATAVAHATPLLVAEHHRRHADVQERSRALGRLALLFDDPGLLDTVPRLLAEMEPAEVATVARRLAEAPQASLVMRPGPHRTRPSWCGSAMDVSAEHTPQHGPSAPSSSEGASSKRSATQRPSMTGRQRPAARPVPGPGPQPSPNLDRLRDAVLPNGITAIAVPDGRAPLAEVRLRMPLGPVGWTRAATVPAYLRALAARTPVAERLGGGLSATSDGQWLDLGGHVPTDRLDDWLSLVRALIEAPVDSQPESAAPGPGSPDRAMDEAIRQRWFGPQRLGQLTPDPRGAVLTVVGAIDAERAVAAVASAFVDWAPEPTSVCTPDLAGTSWLSLPVSGATETHLTVSTPESTDDDEVAKFLATAVIGGGPDARMVARAVRGGYHARTGRDRCGTVPRSYLRAQCTPDALAGVLADLDDERARLRTEPLSAAEVDPVREYCAAQLLSAFDSPGTLADLLSNVVAAGREPRWLQNLSPLLHKVSVTDVADAAQRLFSVDGSCTVVYGAVTATSAVPLSKESS